MDATLTSALPQLSDPPAGEVTRRQVSGLVDLEVSEQKRDKRALRRSVALLFALAFTFYLSTILLGG